MTMKPNWHLEFEQGSDAWKVYRSGKVTASMVSDIFAGGTGKSRENALADLVQELLTGKPVESFSNHHTQRGTENEPIGRMLYEAYAGDEVQTVGFIDHPFLKGYGASPDGFREESGKLIGLELKNRSAAIHIQVLNGREIPGKDMFQMIAQMDCCEFDAVDYGSYNPDFPGKMALHVVRVWRTAEVEKLITERQWKIKAFIDEAHEQVDNLRRKYG
jgi:hypothetical protein